MIPAIFLSGGTQAACIQFHAAFNIGTVPIGTGEFRRIHSLVSRMSAPVERSITVSAPQRIAHVILPTSSSIDDEIADVAQLLHDRKLNGVVVVDEKGKLVGILTTTNALEALIGFAKALKK